MSDLIFPALRGIKYPISKIPEWNTKIQTSASGIERSASYWATPRWTFKLSSPYLDDTGDENDYYNQLVGLFMQCKGAYGSFLFCNDEITRQTSTFIPTQGVTNTISFDTISFGGYKQPIDGNKIVFNQILGIKHQSILYDADPDITTEFMDDDAFMDEEDTYMGDDIPNFVLSTDYNIDTNVIVAYGYNHTGYFPPGTYLKATFNYYFRCRFLQDQTEFQTFLQNLTENTSVEMITLK